MPTSYIGSATATEAPSAQPAGGVSPTLSLPTDGDGLNVASITQPFKTLADFIAYIQKSFNLTNPAVTIPSISAAGPLPLAQWLDGAGRGRWLIDHNGFPMGNIIQFQEAWLFASGLITSTTTNFDAAGKWGLTITGTGTTTALVGGNSSNLCNLFQIRPDNGNVTAGAYLETHFYLINSAPTYQSAVADFSISSDTPAATGTYLAGFCTSGLPASAGDFAWFKKGTSDTNWQCQCLSSSTGLTTTVNSGVVGPTTTMQRMRIESHGATSTYGAAKMLFFINEVLVANITTNLPVGGGWVYSFKADSGVATTLNSVSFGPLFYSSNRYQSSPSL